MRLKIADSNFHYCQRGLMHSPFTFPSSGMMRVALLLSPILSSSTSLDSSPVSTATPPSAAPTPTGSVWGAETAPQPARTIPQCKSVRKIEFCRGTFIYKLNSLYISPSRKTRDISRSNQNCEDWPLAFCKIYST